MKTGILCTKNFLNSAQKPIYSASNNLLHMWMKKKIPLMEEEFWSRTLSLERRLMEK